MSSKSARFSSVVLAALMLGGGSATLSAMEALTAVRDAPWRFGVDIYGWLPKAPATIKIDGHEVANLPESFDNIIDSLDMAAMLRFDAHKGPLGFFASPIYYKGDYSEHFTGLLGERRKFELSEKVWLIDYGVSYEIGRWDIGDKSGSRTATLEPYAGFRFLHDKIKIDVDPGRIENGVRVRKTISTNAPIIGLQSRWRLSDRWSLYVSGDYGGFNVDGMDNTYQGIGTVNYHFKWGKVAYKAYAGYRYTHLEYKDNPP